MGPSVASVAGSVNGSVLAGRRAWVPRRGIAPYLAWGMRRAWCPPCQRRRRRLASVTTGQQALPYRGGMEATTEVRHLRSGPRREGQVHRRAAGRQREGGRRVNVIEAKSLDKRAVMIPRSRLLGAAAVFCVAAALTLATACSSSPSRPQAGSAAGTAGSTGGTAGSTGGTVSCSSAGTCYTP